MRHKKSFSRGYADFGESEDLAVKKVILNKSRSRRHNDFWFKPRKKVLHILSDFAKELKLTSTEQKKEGACLSALQ